jgi:hypothetical protein
VCTLLATWFLALILGPWLGTLLTNPETTLVGPASPAGIINLQLAFTVERADSILTAWGSQKRAACEPAQHEGSATLRDCARQSLVAEFELILLYVALGTWSSGPSPKAWRWSTLVSGACSAGHP